MSTSQSATITRPSTCHTWCASTTKTDPEHICSAHFPVPASGGDVTVELAHCRDEDGQFIGDVEIDVTISRDYPGLSIDEARQLSDALRAATGTAAAA